MYFRQLISNFVRTLSGRQALPAVGLAALSFFSGPSPLQAGPCPPCSGDANECAYQCCLYQDCNSWNIISCTAWCSLGYAAAEIWEDGEDAPAIKSFTGQSQADCHGDNRIGVLPIPPVGSRNVTKRIEIGLLGVDKKFRASAEGIVGVVVEVAPKKEYMASGGRPRWEPLGRALFATDQGIWALDWNLAMYNAPEYVVRVVATRKNGRIQEARGLASSPTF